MPDSLVKQKQEMMYLPVLGKPLHDEPIPRASIQAALKENRLNEVADSLEIKEWYNRHFFKQYVKLEFMMIVGKGRGFSAAFTNDSPLLSS